MIGPVATEGLVFTVSSSNDAGDNSRQLSNAPCLRHCCMYYAHIAQFLLPTAL